MTYIKSPFNYTGNKYRILNQLFSYLPSDSDSFLDLFAGGCDVIINASAKSKFANDIDSILVDVFKEFQKHSLDYIFNYIQERILQFKLSKSDSLTYYKFRDFYNNSDRNPLDLFVLNCFCFNHSLRFNRHGDFNQASGKGKSSFNLSLQHHLKEFHSAISTIEFSSFDFRDIVISSSNTFIFCDPPYLGTDTVYNRNWSDTDQYDLFSMLDSFTSKGFQWALTINDQELVRLWLQNKSDYKIIPLTNRFFNYHSGNVKSNELLIINYEFKGRND